MEETCQIQDGESQEPAQSVSKCRLPQQIDGAVKMADSVDISDPELTEKCKNCTVDLDCDEEKGSICANDCNSDCDNPCAKVESSVDLKMLPVSNYKDNELTMCSANPDSPKFCECFELEIIESTDVCEEALSESEIQGDCESMQVEGVCNAANSTECDEASNCDKVKDTDYLDDQDKSFEPKLDVDVSCPGQSSLDVSKSDDQPAVLVIENKHIDEGAISEGSSCAPPHDVYVAIINGPVSMSDSRSDDLDATSRNCSNSMSSLTDGSSNDQEDGSVNATLASFDDDDMDPELLDVNNIQSPEREVQPLYEVGPSVTSECEICLEHKDLRLRLCCGTPICDMCMTTYLESVIKTGKVKIECPGLCQQKYIHRDEIIGRVSIEMKEKFCKFLVDANNEPHIKTCPRCSHVMHVELMMIRNPRVKKKGLPVVCSECQLYWCFPCQAPWHEGITCKDHRKGNKLLKKWAKQKFLGQYNAQRCPRCKVYIQRITGCDHMTCSKCDTSFCYRCGERYLHLKCIGDHYSRLSIFGCKYIYKPDNPLQRKLVRGSIFGAKLLAAPVVGVLAVGIGSVLLSGALIFFLPCYGINKYRRHRREMRRRQAQEEEYRRWRLKLEEIRNAGDPYVAEYNRLRGLGVNPHRLVAASQVHQQVRGPGFISEEDFERRGSILRHGLPVRLGGWRNLDVMV